eukprot:4289468-Alexandrium_andersonii.AAC.1
MVRGRPLTTVAAREGHKPVGLRPGGVARCRRGCLCRWSYASFAAFAARLPLAPLAPLGCAAHRSCCLHRWVLRRLGC